MPQYIDAVQSVVMFVKGPEGCKEMLGIGSVIILDGKVVDPEGEGDRTGGMTEKSQCVLDWRVTGKGQVRDQALVG